MSRKLSRSNTAVVDALQQSRETRGNETSRWSNIPVTVTTKNAKVAHIDVESITENPHQPRRRFDKEEMLALQESIARYGLLEPIGVIPTPNGLYQLAYGERRLRAIKALGQSTVACVCLDADVPADEITIVENLHRQDLDPFEEADAFAALAERRGYSYADLATLLRRSKSEIGRTMSLLKLPPVVRSEYSVHQPARSVLHAIAAMKAEDDQIGAWEAFKTSKQPVPAADTQTNSNNGPSRIAGRDVTDRERPDTILSALPLRVARKIHHAHAVLSALRDEPKALWQSDFATLRDMRDAIDQILATAPSSQR